VCDRIKSTLSRAALQHVLSLENKADDGWLKLSALLEALDMYYDTHLTSNKPRTVQSAISKVTDGTTESVQANVPQTKMAQGAPGNFQQKKQYYQSTENKSGRRQCYVCGSYNHISTYHGKPASNGSKAQAHHANASADKKFKSVNAFTAAVEMLNQETQVDLLPVTDSCTESDLPDLFVTDLSICRVDVGQADVTVTRSASSQDARSGDGDVQVQAVTPTVDKVGNTVDKPLQLTDFVSLSYLPVVVSDNQGNRCVLSGLSDLGAEVALANAAAISELKPVDIGFVKIEVVIGESISVLLVRLNIASADHSDCVVSFVCAVCADANSALILTADVVSKLMPQVDVEPRCNVVFQTVTVMILMVMTRLVLLMIDLGIRIKTIIRPIVTRRRFVMMILLFELLMLLMVRWLLIVRLRVQLDR